MKSLPLPSVNQTKRLTLGAGMSSVLAACGVNTGDSPSSASAVDADAAAQLPSTLTESTLSTKSYNGDLGQLVFTMVRELLTSRDTLVRWNQIAIDASGRDHTPVQSGETRVFGEQMGPCRSSRAIAIVHIAMNDSLASITGALKSVNRLQRAPIYSEIQAALAQAAHDTLVGMFPSQAPIFAAALARDLTRTNPLHPWCQRLNLSADSRAAGLQAGARAATAVLADRANDGSAHPEPVYGVDFIPKAGVGIWSPDPISNGRRAMGARWSEVRPFTLSSAAQFRLPPLPAFGSRDYAQMYGQVQDLGGDGVITPTRRTADQTEAGVYWAYDGTPSLCAPPRLYNQVAVHIANQKDTKTLGLMRLLMLVNVSMADAAIASWESKYYYQFWRPVTGLRASINGTAGGSSTPNFTPLGAPASNLTGPNFTPPFPAYPSGHATFGGALFQTLRNFYGTDNIAFTFVSDEYNGSTKDNQGNVRPRKPRSFANLTQAEKENGESRIYLGIHWACDMDEGIAQGRKVADLVGKTL